MVVVIDVLINEFDQLAERGKPVEVARFGFEMAVKRLLVAILPRGSLGTHRQLSTNPVY